MNKLRVLIVDDKPQVRQGLRILLPLAGEQGNLPIEIAGEASDGQTAIEQALVLQPDVILMDLEMPHMDGYAATEAIHALFPTLKIVALTVHSDPASRQLAQDAGCDDLIEKGMPASDLIRALLPKERII